MSFKAAPYMQYFTNTERKVVKFPYIFIKIPWEIQIFSSAFRFVYIWTRIFSVFYFPSINDLWKASIRRLAPPLGRPNFFNWNLSIPSTIIMFSSYASQIRETKISLIFVNENHPQRSHSAYTDHILVLENCFRF